MKNGTSLFSLRNIKILTNMQKNFFEILVQTALTVGLLWTILKLTPKSTLLSFTILYSIAIQWNVPDSFYVEKLWFVEEFWWVLLKFSLDTIQLCIYLGNCNSILYIAVSKLSKNSEKPQFSRSYYSRCSTAPVCTIETRPLWIYKP